ncbi:MAG: hydrogen peroxide-inducible genes activator [Alphaproteobacteria bacterium]
MLPTIKQLSYLIALAERKSFSKAAEQCFVTQSTLSAGIKELETILGQDVVDRQTRAVKLTPLGQEILKTAKRVLAEIDTMMRRAQNTQEPFSLPLRLGVIPTIAPYLLPDILPPLKAQYPALDIHLYEDLTAHLLDKLQAREIDVALMAFPYENEAIEHSILFEEPFCLATSESTLKQKSITLDFLKDHDILLLEDGHCLRDHALQACRLRSSAQKKTFSATSLATLIQMVSHGYGMTLLPAMAADPASLPANIKLIPFKSPKPTRQIGLAWRKGDPNRRDYELLAKAIEKVAK